MCMCTVQYVYIQFLNFWLFFFLRYSSVSFLTVSPTRNAFPSESLVGISRGSNVSSAYYKQLTFLGDSVLLL